MKRILLIVCFVLFTTMSNATELFVEESANSSNIDDSIDFLIGIGIETSKHKLYLAQEREQTDKFSLYHAKTQPFNFFEYEDFYAESEEQWNQSARLFLNKLTKNKNIFYRYGLSYIGDHYDDFELIGYAKASFYKQTLELESDLNENYRATLNINITIYKTNRWTIKPVLELKYTQDSIWFMQKLKFVMSLNKESEK